MRLWRRLKPYCLRAGIETQAELAKRRRVTREHLNRVLNGADEFTEPLEHRITYLLKLSSDEINDAYGFPGGRSPSVGDTRKAVESGARLSMLAGPDTGELAGPAYPANGRRGSVRN